MGHITDLDDAILRCRPVASKDYAEEALAAYRAGAYRACIVTTWIAVVFDLIEKMREIALFGNNEARSKLEKFEKWQEQIAQGNDQLIGKVLEFERNLLEYVRDKFELIDGQQFIELSRLRYDRNRCAHPTLQGEGTPYQPSGEAARAYLSFVMIHLLQQPPVQGRSALAELKKLISSEYFPRQTTLAKKALIDSVFARPSDQLVRGAVDELLFGFFTPNDAYYRKRQALAALSAIIEIRRTVAEPRLIEQTHKIFPRIGDDDIPNFIDFMLSIHECRSALSEIHYTKLSNYIDTGPVQTVGPLAERAYALIELRQAVKQRVNKLEAKELAALIGNEGVQEVAVDRAVDLYCGAKNWVSANYIAENLVLPILTHLTAAHITRVINAPSNEGADLPGSHGFSEFLERVRKEKVIDPESLDKLLVDNNMKYYIPKGDSDNDDIPF